MHGWPVIRITPGCIFDRDRAKRAQGMWRGWARQRRRGCLAAGTACAGRGVTLPIHSHVGKLSGNKTHVGFLCSAHNSMQPWPPRESSLRLGDLGFEDPRAVRREPPLSSPTVTKKPRSWREGERKGRARAWRVPQATVGTIPHVFVQTFTCQPLLQPFPLLRPLP